MDKGFKIKLTFSFHVLMKVVEISRISCWWENWGWRECYWCL